MKKIPFRDVARIQNRREFCNYRRAQYVSQTQSESKLGYLNTAYNVIFQLENLSSQTSISPAPGFYLHLCLLNTFYQIGEC